MKTLHAAFLAFLLASGAPLSAARAEPPVLITAPGGLAVTDAEVAADAAQRIPSETRGQILSIPGNVAQLATNLMMRRLLAGQAEQSGLDKDPQVALQLRLARERVLAEARLMQIDGKPSDRATLEKAALAEYRAEQEKFTTPEQVRVRHILIDARACEAEKRAEQLLQQVRAPGADFAALAEKDSQDPGSAKRGGDLGFFERGRMAAEFEKAAFALKSPGDVSDVVRTQFGFHIIKLEERRPAGRQPFEKVRDQLIQDIGTREVRRRRTEATEDLQRSLQLDQAAVDAFAKAPH